ncbi:hypothetical protein TWF718_007093 [Orbilia javanica]|uniref:Uncharacterized protein n=1 Tax=Orbilia javanica TaxID=47235 RepID=A0AAN8N6E1_9PEZI
MQLSILILAAAGAVAPSFAAPLDLGATLGGATNTVGEVAPVAGVADALPKTDGLPLPVKADTVTDALDHIGGPKRKRALGLDKVVRNAAADVDDAAGAGDRHSTGRSSFTAPFPFRRKRLVGLDNVLGTAGSLPVVGDVAAGATGGKDPVGGVVGGLPVVGDVAAGATDGKDPVGGVTGGLPVVGGLRKRLDLGGVLGTATGAAGGLPVVGDVAGGATGGKDPVGGVVGGLPVVGDVAGGATGGKDPVGGVTGGLPVVGGLRKRLDLGGVLGTATGAAGGLPVVGDVAGGATGGKDPVGGVVGGLPVVDDLTGSATGALPV